jgi:hypothetical protein
MHITEDHTNNKYKIKYNLVIESFIKGCFAKKSKSKKTLIIIVIIAKLNH